VFALVQKRLCSKGVSCKGPKPGTISYMIELIKQKNKKKQNIYYCAPYPPLIFFLAFFFAWFSCTQILPKNRKKRCGGQHNSCFPEKQLFGNRDFAMLGVNGLLFFLVHHFGEIVCDLNPWLAQVLLVRHVQHTPSKGSYAIWNYSVFAFVKAWCQFGH
jgi:hypothetical protein